MAEEKNEGLPKKLQEILDKISELSILEVSQLVKAMEEKFGVSAAPSQVVATVAGAAMPAASEVAGETEEKTTFDVILTSGGDTKINVIKAVREVVPTLGLKEAKDLVEGAPKPIKEGIKKEEAEEIKKKVEAAGGKVELK